MKYALILSIINTTPSKVSRCTFDIVVTGPRPVTALYSWAVQRDKRWREHRIGFAREWREATLTYACAEEWITAAKVGEMPRPAPAPITFTFVRVAQPTAAPQRARHSPGARGPQRRRADARVPTSRELVTVPGLQWTHSAYTLDWVTSYKLFQWKSNHWAIRR